MNFHRYKKMMRKLSREKLLRQYIKSSQEQWEQEYKNKRWDMLGDLSELARYQIIVGYYNFFLSDKGKILDVGCGRGDLQEKFPKDGYQCYLGIDLSSEAIRQASDKVDNRTLFMAVGAHEFETGETFDCIIFNEVLYYFEEPIKILEKYISFLKETGVIIISQYCDPKLDYTGNWKKIDNVYPPADAVKISHASGLEWIIKVYKDINN